MSQPTLNRPFLQYMPIAVGRFAIAREGEAPQTKVYPSQAVAEVIAHCETLKAVEQAVTGPLAKQYEAALANARATVADDLEAWSLQGFPTRQRLFFSAEAKAIEPRLLQRAGCAAARYLQQTGVPVNSLFDELLSEYARICLPGLWRSVDSPRELFEPLFHAKAIRQLANSEEGFSHVVLECGPASGADSAPLEKISIAAASQQLKQLFTWYFGADRAVLGRNLTPARGWQHFLATQELLPSLEIDELWAITARLVDATTILHGVDVEHEASREKLQKAALTLAQWSAWSQRR